MFYAFLALIFLLILLFTPTVYKVYERCYYPVLRAPTQEISLNCLNLLIVSLATSSLYAVSGGSIMSIIKPTRFDSTFFLYGAAVGSIIFFSGRIWALHRTHSFAQSNLFTAIIIFSTYCALFLFYPDYSTKISDEIIKVSKDQLSLLAIVFAFAFTAALLSELFGYFNDFILKENSLVSFSLFRQQIEYFERYERIRNEDVFCHKVEKEINLAILNSINCKKVLTIYWLTANGYPRVKEIIMKFKLKYPEIIELKILAHESEDNRFSLMDIPTDIIKYTQTDGALRLIIIGNRMSFMGVQMGLNRHSHFPDYVILMTNKIRVSELKTNFCHCWENS